MSDDDHAARAINRGAEVIHRRKNFNGRETAQQVHAELAWWKKRCTACGGPPAMRVQVYLLLTDLPPDARAVAELEIAAKRVIPLALKGGDAVRVSEVYACTGCKASVERVIARDAPSYAIIDRDYGPGPDSPIVGVPRAIV